MNQNYIKLVALSWCIWISCTANLSSAQALLADTNVIKQHFVALTKTENARNYKNLAQLNVTAAYIFDHFKKYADSTVYQTYDVGGKEFKNVICSFGTEYQERLVIGAHYDVCGEQEGADDNASGVIGLLELARLLHEKKMNYRIDLVAYTLEEPPFFRTEYMGSAIHAKSLFEAKTPVKGMIVLEMIAYFKTEKKTQHYPLKILSLVYGNRGDYITLVKKFGSGKFVRQFCREFKRNASIRTKRFTGPPALEGIDFSDHLNYWYYDYPALMITDTAFYRNANYHQKSDRMEELDFQRMAAVITTVFNML